MHERTPAAPWPPAGPLTCALVDFRGDVRAERPAGRQDWLLTFTISGRGRFDGGGQRRFAGSGDVTIIRPGVPHDYGVDLTVGAWKKIWVHFVPRVETIEWLNWPEILPGHGQVRLEKEVRGEVLGALRRMHRFHISVAWRKAELAMSAFEQALLLCDGANPQHEETQRDPRILKAVDAICRNLRTDLSVQELARRAGLSRSRFVQLFHAEMGVPPRDFVEQQRLLRASELLQYSSMNVGQVAAEVGFDCPFYFSQRFKRKFGNSPRMFRG